MAAVNPFDVNNGAASGATTAAQASTADPGLLAGASTQIKAPTTADNVSKIDNTLYNPNTKAQTQAQATGYNGAQAQATDWNVDDKQTVQGQLGGILSSNSQLLQKAQADAAQTANGRGLLNSSMAAGAGTSALLDKALQIATPDAATNATAAQTNANAKNTVALANQSSTNAGAQFTAGAQNAASSQNATADNALQSQNLQTNAQIAAQNAAAQNTAASQDAQLNQNAQLANQDNATKVALAQYQAATQVSMQNADAQTKVALQNIDANTRTQLANIEAQYKNQMQASASASEMYKQTVQNITTIMTDKDLDAGAKQAAIDNQFKMLQNGFKVNEAIGGLNLAGLLDIGAGTAPIPAPAPAQDQYTYPGGGGNPNNNPNYVAPYDTSGGQ